MITLLKYTISLFLFAALFTSCKGNKGETEKADAVLLWSGEYASDGCGFTVQIGDTIYKPADEAEIPEKFKAALRTPITIEFVRLNDQIDRRCGLSTDSKAMEAIRIVSVKKR